jgi:hypothetical protein
VENVVDAEMLCGDVVAIEPSLRSIDGSSMVESKE